MSGVVNIDAKRIEQDLLTDALCKVIDDYRSEHPVLLVATIFRSLEEIRHGLSVGVLRSRMTHGHR